MMLDRNLIQAWRNLARPLRCRSAWLVSSINTQSLVLGDGVRGGQIKGYRGIKGEGELVASSVCFRGRKRRGIRRCIPQRGKVEGDLEMDRTEKDWDE